MKKYKIIFSDIDGTLLMMKPGSKRNCRGAAKSGQKRNSFCAGISPYAGRNASDPGRLGIHAPMVCYSGGLVLGPDNEEIYSCLMDLDLACEIKNLIEKEFPQVVCGTYGGEHWVVDDGDDPWVLREQEITHLVPETGDIREYLGKQESQNEDQKVFHKDTLEVSQLSKNRENLMDKIKHTVVHSVTSFSDMRAGILKEIREEKGQYDYTDVVNACGLSYARLYSEIEERYKNGNEQYYKSAGGTPWTKEEIEWLDMQYEQEVAWQKSCARIAARGQVFQGNIPEVPTKEIEELEDSFYQAKDAYIKLYQESKQTGKFLVLQNYMLGSSRMYEMLNKLGNLQERVE